jgi:hypothetical protein
MVTDRCQGKAGRRKARIETGGSGQTGSGFERPQKQGRAG